MRPLTRALATALALAACDTPDRAPRGVRREVWDAPDADVAPDGALRGIPPERDVSVVAAEPVDVGASQCPGMRVVRVDRRHVAAPAGAPALPPRFYGRDGDGHVWSFRDVLACELRVMNWVTKPHPEGINLVLWRGPYIFEPDGECEWREPVRTEPFDGGRRLFVRERCRRRGARPAERTVVVEVSRDYRRLTAR